MYALYNSKNIIQVFNSKKEAKDRNYDLSIRECFGIDLLSGSGTVTVKDLSSLYEDDIVVF